LPVIILTAHGTIPEAVEATQRGVFGYLTKPYESQVLLAEVARALRLSGGLNGSNGSTGTGPADEAWRAEIITRNPAMEALLAQTRLVAGGDASVLIRGESGSGKELLARAIHLAGRRRERPFMAVNCGAIPEQLLESELFGHVKGSFTGATRDHNGLFREAQGGTLLLDEIGDMPVPLQVKLLRVIQERQVRPVGSAVSVAIDVRIISATHRPLEEDIADGIFRSDLFYRLNVVSLTLPSLSERRDDIPLLASHFLQTLGTTYGKTIGGFAPDALALLVGAAWPGNVRQLYNVVEHVVALSTTPLISTSLVQSALRETQEMDSLETAKAHFEREYLAQVLRISGGNVSHAARLAKRNRTEFYKLLQRHQLDPTLFK